MKNKRVIALGILILLIIASLYSLNIFRLYKLSQKTRAYRIIFLYYIYSTTNRLHLDSLWQYNTEATLGLELAIGQEFKELHISYEAIHFEKSKSGSSLDRAFLDSADLIVVRGLSYWWKYASDEDKYALFQTSTPVITSVCYGDETSPSLLEMLTGVERATIKYVDDAIIEFTEHAQAPLRNRQYIAGGGTIVDVNTSGSAKVYAYAIKGGRKYPVLIFNGTKNFLINIFTYRVPKQYEQRN